MRLAVTNGGSLLDALSTEGTLIARAVMNQKRHINIKYMKNMVEHTNITKQVWGQIDFEVGFELSYKIMISREIFENFDLYRITEIEIK